MKSMKLQSAMEYLMTYGWAILVIAVVMVALFSLGIIGGGAGLGNSCIAQSGYLCGGPLFSSGTGNLIVTVGQASGGTWTVANVRFVPSGTAIPTNPNSLFTSYQTENQISGGLVPSQQVTITVPINDVTGATGFYAVGQTTQGTLWAQYQTAGTGSSFFYAQLATVTLKAS